MPVTTYPVGGEVPISASRLMGYGHSLMAGGGATHAERQYVFLLAGLLRADGYVMAVGGADISHDENWLGDTASRGGWAWVLQNVIPPAANTAPYGPEGFVPVAHFGNNDVNHHATDAIGNPRTVWKESIRTVLSRLSSTAVFEDTDATVAYGGMTWQPAHLSVLRNSGRSIRPIPGSTATFTITLPADFEGGTVAVGFTTFPGCTGSVAWSGTAAHGSPAATTFNNKAHRAGGTTPRRNSSNGVVIRFTGLTTTDATKTIIGTYTAGSSTTFTTPPNITGITTAGTAGTTTYSYKRVYRTWGGDTIPSASVGSITTGNATLSVTNYNIIPAGAAWQAGVEYELIYRTVGGTQQGIVAILSAPAIVNDQSPLATAYTARTASPLLEAPAFDYWQIESTNPPTKGVAVNAHRQSSGYINGAADADIANYNTDLAAVVAEFGGSWVVSDVDAVLNKTAAYFATDGLHPNDRGHGLVAQTVFASMASLFLGETNNEIAMQSRAARSVRAFGGIILKWAADSTLPHGIYQPSAGVIAAANLPYTGTGMADYTLDGTVRRIDNRLLVALPAIPGDRIQVDLSCLLQNVSILTFLDCAFVDGTTLNPIRFFSANPTTPTTLGNWGWPGWVAPATGAFNIAINGPAYAIVEATDLTTMFTVPGQVLVALHGKTASSTRILLGGASSGLSAPLSFQVKNLGRPNGATAGS